MAGAAATTSRQIDPLGGAGEVGAPETAKYLSEHELWPHLRALVRIAEAALGRTSVSVSLAEYDDLSTVRLVQTRFNAGLSGREAIAKEDEIADRMLEAAGPEAANHFLVIVR